MSTTLLHCFLFFLALGGFHAINAADPVHVNIYYETLCPDSKKFMLEQFNKTYFDSEDIQKNLNVAFLPFGKGNNTGGKNESSFLCQHGPVECQGNKFQACGIKFINDEKTLVKFLSCVMNNTLPTNPPNGTVFPIDSCLPVAGNVSANISTCYNDSNWEILDKVYNDTKAFFGNHTYSVPYISFNNTLNDTISVNATTDFKKSLCTQLKSMNLKTCISSASTITASIIPAVILLLLSKLM